MLDLRANLRLHPQIQKLTCLFSPVKNKPLYQIRQYNSKYKVKDRHDNEEIVRQLDKVSPELGLCPLISKKTCLLNSITVMRYMCSLINFVTGLPVLIRRDNDRIIIDSARPIISHGTQAVL